MLKVLGKSLSQWNTQMKICIPEAVASVHQDIVAITVHHIVIALTLIRKVKYIKTVAQGVIFTLAVVSLGIIIAS